ncbi:MAG: molybdenum cofactor biosynthesis protein MoaE [Verrucomicrobiota bacterium]|nr:molybdenum cofactor biosynthesis protein MoaE [Limisphaera sp.]MDW8382025.1 molybdenum cofactor biosynthesis protein MoaE [Verrucomicrobiota bacterium]
MQIEVQLTNARLEDLPPARPPRGATGAWVEFRGLIRDTEAGQPIVGLEYEAYERMARSEMERLLTELAREYPCQAVQVLHRTGLIPVGEAAIIVRIAAVHRHEAFALLTRFMDRLKEDVPIWKCRARVADTCFVSTGIGPTSLVNDSLQT